MTKLLPWQKKAIAFIQSENWIGRLGRFEDRRLRTELMTRDEIISRRFEAMRMRWPEKTVLLIQQEMLILGWFIMRPDWRCKIGRWP